MDPVAHTLIGATLAQTGLKRLTRYATAALLIGSNIADIDVIAQFWGGDAALYHRRGWTHGVLALILWPLLLTGAFWLWHRWRTRAGPQVPSAPSFRPGMIFALSCLAIWLHPLLDWLNTYGVRLLMPFDGRWFYGDTLFIIDPWIWLLAAAGVVLAWSKNLSSIGGWILLATLASVLIVMSDYAAAGVKLAWFLGLALLVASCWRLRRSTAELKLGRISAVALVIYICSVYGMARLAESQAFERFPAQQVQSNPVPGKPHAHRIVLADDKLYRIIAADGKVYELAREQPDDVVRAALAAESIRGFANWTRFPYWTVSETADSWIVQFQDLRYQGPDIVGSAIGFAQVDVPKAADAR